jgi:hypothetical protein
VDEVKDDVEVRVQLAPEQAGTTDRAKPPRGLVQIPIGQNHREDSSKPCWIRHGLPVNAD